MLDEKNDRLQNRIDNSKIFEYMELDRFPSFQEARFEFEKDYLVRLLTLTDGNVSRAATCAKRNRTEFYRLLSRHMLKPNQFKESE